MLDRLESVKATHAAHDVSEKYAFVSTEKVLKTLANEGWFPVSGYEKRANKPEYRGFQKHVIRLRKEAASVLVNDARMELILINSHNRGSSVGLMAGLWRAACENGLVVSMGYDFAFAIRHVGYAEEKVYCALNHIESHLKPLHERIQVYRTLQLNDEMRLAFAKQAALLRWEEGKIVDPKHLLISRRDADIKKDLWTVFNVVQENMIRGANIRLWTNGRRLRVNIRPVTGLDANLKLNKDLWALMESFALTLEWRNSQENKTVELAV